jgi:hypothetical protein
MELHIGMWLLVLSADLDLMFSDRLNQDERTTMRGGNGTPYLLLACAHLSMGPLVRYLTVHACDDDEMDGTAVHT